MTSKLKTLTLAVGAAALMAPVASAGKPTENPGKAKSEQRSAKAKKKGHAKPKNAVFRGTVVSADATAGSVVVKVTSASKWGRRFDEQEVTFTVASVKRIKVADVNQDGKRDLADFSAGDRVHVQARVTKDSDASGIAARKVDNKSAKAPEPEESEADQD